MREWILKNTREVILLQLRDTRESDVGHASEETSLADMFIDPVFIIQNKWEAMQSYSYNYLKDIAPAAMSGKLKYITLQYVPKESKKAAALNFHLTQKEKDDIYESINMPENNAAVDALVRMLR